MVQTCCSVLEADLLLEKSIFPGEFGKKRFHGFKFSGTGSSLESLAEMVASSARMATLLPLVLVGAMIGQDKSWDCNSTGRLGWSRGTD